MEVIGLDGKQYAQAKRTVSKTEVVLGSKNGYQPYRAIGYVKRLNAYHDSQAGICSQRHQPNSYPHDLLITLGTLP